MASPTLVPLVPSTLVPKTKASSVFVPKKNSGLSVGYAIGAAIVLRSQAGPRVRVGKSKSSGSYPFEPLGFRGPRFVCSANIRAGINETCQRSVGTYEFLSPCRSVSLQSLGFDSSWESPYGLLPNTRLRALVNEDTGDKETHPGRRESLGLWERMSLALHPVMCILRDIEMFLRENVKGITIAASIAIALGVAYFFLKLTAISSLKSVPYSDLVTGLQEGAVTTVLFEEGSSNIYWDTKSWLGKSEIPSSIAQAGNMIARKDLLQNPGEVLSQMLTKLKNTIASTHLWEYSTRMVDIDEYYLLTLLKQKGIEYSSAPRSIFMTVKGALDPGLKTMGTYLVTYCLPVWISMLPIVWVQMNQFSSFNKPAKKRKPSNQKASFQDVEGVDTAKAELTEVVSCLQNAYIYKKVGAKLPRGVLLVGPPGTGKTLLARAVAGEAGVPVFIASASEFVEVFVGRGASRIRDLFNEARKKAPSIIFIDELDAVGGKRGRNSFNSEQEQTLNQLLTEMDGFDSDMKVIVIAATNRPETLDPALLRPGRFSRKVFVGEPDEDGRRKILAVHMRGYSFEEDKNVICSLIASLTPGMTGANLANIINEAALLAARRGREKVSSEDFMEAIEREKCGINDKEGTASRMGRNDSGQDGSSGMAMHGPLGIPNLSWAN